MGVDSASVLSALLISFAILILVIVIGLSSNRMLDKKKFVLWTLLIEYLFLLVSVTFVFRTTLSNRSVHLAPMWIYSQLVTELRMMAIRDIITNLLLFLPVGALLAGINPSLKWYQVLLIALACSLTIEVLQYTFLRGVAQTDDLLHNTVSCLLGWGGVKGVVGATPK